MKGLAILVLGSFVVVLAGCRSSRSATNAQYSYMYDFDQPLQAVEPVVFTSGLAAPEALPAPTTPVANASNSRPVFGNSSVVTESTPSRTATELLLESQEAAGEVAVPIATQPTSTTVINVPIESLATNKTSVAVPNGSAGVTTVIEPSSSQNTLEKKTVIVDAPVRAVTNDTTTIPSQNQPIK